ncbi:dihydropteroate synthase [Salinibacterium xinjiangense]|uniref:Dihydropteroate synthase n=1 Tax=Salinibacterium xinjiangense TaxID=386302 RepID=A0A2C8YHI3_9MICO|nr:dihydropteroate synthase [Salinibacterium xinjiangense]GGK97141.1 dihydropteroate synthase [Salinibacterium xinjiangense]SOE49821.1 dihydropteroate synthase [Salinibacterium xinjiangense]
MTDIAPTMVRSIGRRTFDFNRQVAVMAVINRTPDSFYDKGATFELDRAVAAALAAVAEGADWIDIGGVPFGRGPVVTVDDEIERVIPVVEAIAAASDVVISVDTTVAAVAERAIAAGAGVINDTSGLWDPAMLGVVAASGATLVLTHSKGEPRAEKSKPVYDDVVGEVIAYLRGKVDAALAGGIPLERLVIDPGHDLNKNTLHSLEITRRFDEIAAIGLPALAAVSNKDFIGESIGREQGQRLAGSLAAATVCILNGARIIRMHDVRASVDAVRMTEAILGMRQPVQLIHNMHPELNV